MKRSPFKRRRRKRNPDVEGDQWTYCHEQRCCSCGARPPNFAHHVTRRSQGGRDDDCVPMCYWCHDRLHVVGPEEFEEKNKLDLAAVAAKLAKEAPWNK